VVLPKKWQADEPSGVNFEASTVLQDASCGAGPAAGIRRGVLLSSPATDKPASQPTGSVKGLKLGEKRPRPKTLNLEAKSALLAPQTSS
jgi:hypothetical protein